MTGTVFTKKYNEPEFDRGEILRYAGCRKHSEQIDTLIDECVSECRSVLTYSVCFCEVAVDIAEPSIGEIDMSFTHVKSTALTKNLTGCKAAVIFAATVGTPLDRLITKYSKLSPAKAVIMQAIGAERIESLCDVFCDELSKEVRSRSLEIRPRFSPGYGDLPLEMQRDIFRLLDPVRRIGLTLGETLLMSPTKSVSAIVGLRETVDNERCPI